MSSSAGLFEDEKQSQNYNSRPAYPETIVTNLTNFLNLRSGEKIGYLIDAACGNGQFTRPISKICERVDAFDVSHTQVNQAREHQTDEMKHVTFDVHSCENIPVENESVDVISIAEALHYVDQKAFYKEVDRCLKPNGVLYVIAYNFCEFTDYSEELNNQLQKCWDKYLFGKDYLGPAWDERFKLLFDKYKDMPLYRKDFVRKDEYMKVELTIAQYVKIIRSLSSYVRFYKTKSAAPDIAVQFAEETLKILNKSASELNTMLTSHWPLHMLLFRK